MPRRERLPNRREAERVGFEFRGKPCSFSVGRYPNGCIGEVFIDFAKYGSETDGDAKDAAVCLSLAIQYGVPLSAVRDAVTRTAEGVPTGVVGMVLDLIEAEGLAP